MTLVSLAPDDLGDLVTLITGFMCDRSAPNKTYKQLLETYRACKDTWGSHDTSNDLRITGYIEDMMDGTWRDVNIVIALGIWQGRVVVVDGIHRGVAYLDCLSKGTTPQNLPPLYLGY